MERKLAIIKDVGFGMRDRSFPTLWFTTYTSRTSAALQTFQGQEMLDLVKEAGYYDIKSLEGKSCWVEVRDGLMRFVELAKI